MKQKWLYIITTLSAIIVNIVITGIFQINCNAIQLIVIDVLVCMLVGVIIKTLKK